MLKHKNIWMSIGFVSIVVGLISIFLAMVGVEFQFLAWLHNFGNLISFSIKIGLVLFGFVAVGIANTNWDEGKEDS
jgi:uncharacterized Tic20 family protein